MTLHDRYALATPERADVRSGVRLSNCVCPFRSYARERAGTAGRPYGVLFVVEKQGVIRGAGCVKGRGNIRRERISVEVPPLVRYARS